jgi:hypothetical protein
VPRAHKPRGAPPVSLGPNTPDPRVGSAIANTTGATPMDAAATQLEQTVSAALDEDAWVLFHRAAADLVDALSH